MASFSKCAIDLKVPAALKKEIRKLKAEKYSHIDNRKEANEATIDDLLNELISQKEDIVKQINGQLVASYPHLIDPKFEKQPDIKEAETAETVEEIATDEEDLVDTLAGQSESLAALKIRVEENGKVIEDHGTALEGTQPEIVDALQGKIEKYEKFLLCIKG